MKVICRLLALVSILSFPLLGERPRSDALSSITAVRNEGADGNHWTNLTGKKLHRKSSPDPIRAASGEVKHARTNLRVVAVDDAVTGLAITRGPYLQQGTDTGIIIRWRTNVASDSRVQFGTSAAVLVGVASVATQTKDHQVPLDGLSPDTQYYYSAGSSTTMLASGPRYTFFTAPPVGTAHPTRIWVLGDSGSANSNAASVRNGYAAFAGSRYTDVWLMLGDNAYPNGTDSEYQSAVFDMYPTLLQQTVLWPTIGNHDTAGATNPPPAMPYFEMFNTPTKGEVGGAPSGTQNYYSFDYGRIHFICLDSQTSSRARGGAMVTWLQVDLESTTQDWIIAFWHHPPYSKGAHDSDAELAQTEMRTNILPILTAGGVDLVLCGHSHTYERSFLIDGHYGSSKTFTSAMKLNGGSGRDDGAYTKPLGRSSNQGAVYVVAGSSGKVGKWTGGSISEFNPAPHPTMFYSALHLGSLVIDVDEDRLDAKMIRETGEVGDYFTLLKNIPNTPPVVSIASPADGATFTAPASITITASAEDADGSVAQVDFYAGSTLIGSDMSAPFEVTWKNPPAGTYALTSAATDRLGATTTSEAVSITVSGSGPKSTMLSAKKTRTP